MISFNIRVLFFWNYDEQSLPSKEEFIFSSLAFFFLGSASAIFVLVQMARLPSQNKRSAVSFCSNMASSYSKYLLIGLPVVALAGVAALWWQRNGRRRTYEEIGRVSGLFIYPVKSCKGISVSDIKCVKEGMEFDRWDLYVLLNLANNGYY